MIAWRELLFLEPISPAVTMKQTAKHVGTKTKRLRFCLHLYCCTFDVPPPKSRHRTYVATERGLQLRRLNSIAISCQLRLECCWAQKAKALLWGGRRSVGRATLFSVKHGAVLCSNAPGGCWSREPCQFCSEVRNDPECAHNSAGDIDTHILYTPG